MNIAMLGQSDGLHLRRLARAFAERGHAVHVVSMKPDPVPGASFERFRVPPFGWRYPYRWRRRWEAYLCDLFRRFDVVNAHFLTDWGITEPIARHGCLVVKAYGSDVDDPPETPRPEASLVDARRRLLCAADRVVSPSRAFARKVAAFGGIDSGKIEILPFGVDVGFFSPRAKPDPATTRVGFLKGFQPVYGARTMIDVAAHVLSKRPALRFELVGEGPLRDDCRARAEAYGINHAIHWIDVQPADAVPDLLARWDVLAIPSVKESFCVAAIEAAAMELPVVACNAGGLPEAVDDGRSGLLVESGNAAAFGDAIVSLLDDPPRRRAMGRYARRRVAERFNWQDCVDRWLTLLKEARESKACPAV